MRHSIASPGSAILKIAGHINREAISEHPARAGRETMPATG